MKSLLFTIVRYVEAILKADPAQVDKGYGPTQFHKQTKTFPKPPSEAFRKEKKSYSLPQPASPPLRKRGSL